MSDRVDPGQPMTGDGEKRPVGLNDYDYADLGQISPREQFEQLFHGAGYILEERDIEEEIFICPFYPGP